MMRFNDFGWNLGFGMGFFGLTLMIIFWAAIIWLVVWLISQNKAKTEQNPKAILKTRYANGKITTKEYNEMKKELEN